MKFLITGHTRGIGKAIYSKFGGIGLSKSTGFDISQDDITPYLKNCDVFVNNAYDQRNPWSQVKLIYQAKTTPKQIVIGSVASDFAKWNNRALDYSSLKLSLEASCFQLFNQGLDITLIKPGDVDTDAVADLEVEKIEPDYIANLIEWILKQPHRIKEITVVPYNK